LPAVCIASDVRISIFDTRTRGDNASRGWSVWWWRGKSEVAGSGLAVARAADRALAALYRELAEELEEGSVIPNYMY
jgi:hypothetical protein